MKTPTSSARLSIRTYAAAFVIMVLCSLGIFSLLALDQLARLDAETRMRTERLAQSELIQTVDVILKKTKSLAQDFSVWDETLQQLTNSLYYVFWKENRVKSSGFTPAYFEDLALYDQLGLILSPSSDSELPASLDVTLTQPEFKLIQSGQDSYLYFWQPIVDAPKAKHVIGFVAVKISFFKALKELQNFKYVDLVSIKIKGQRHLIQNAAEIVKITEFNVPPNQAFNQLRQHMLDTLYDLMLIVSVFLIAFLFLVISSIALPLRKLSSHIDALSKGKSSSHHRPDKGVSSIYEIEKVHLSLTNYQSRLENGARALKESEAHKRAILDNVVDGIITIDLQDNIESFNNAAQKIFGYPSDEVYRKPLTLLLEENSRQSYLDYKNQLTSQREALNYSTKPCELTALHRNGNTFPVELSLSLMTLDGVDIYIVVVRDISERKESEERLRFLVNYDPLTGLANRILFRERLEHAMAQARRNDNLSAVLFLDLDRFKTINDTQGHHVGDQLLKAAAQRLKINSRTTDTIARLGGDEFTIIVENMSHIDEAAFFADKICRVMTAPFIINGEQIFVTASIGVTVYPFDDTDYQRLIRNADTAMYRAKDKGGNTYEFYSPDMNAQIQEWLTLENNLRHALTNNEFSLCYQPRVDMRTHTTIGMEALLRWNNPSLGNVSPAKFIPVLEETELIDSVGEWIITTAVKQAKSWHEQGWNNLRVSINISPRQFRQCDLLAYIRRILDEHQFPSQNLELEITESLLVENIDTTVNMLTSLSNLGAHISLDDFGTGYSSLSYLKRFPISTLKIDRSFVKDITTDPDDAAISAAIIAMARSLKMNITAEGIETLEQLLHLTELGCDEAQGFYFSKPLTSSEFGKWLEKEREYKIGQQQTPLLRQNG